MTLARILSQPGVITPRVGVRIETRHTPGDSERPVPSPPAWGCGLKLSSNDQVPSRA